MLHDGLGADPVAGLSTARRLGAPAARDAGNHAAVPWLTGRAELVRFAARDVRVFTPACI
jgi:hypothetical protein